MRKPPKITLLVVDDLIVDQRVQRSLDPRRVKELAAKFKRDGIGVPIVSLRADGTKHVIDGQTRVAVLKEVGLGSSKIHCQTFTDLEVNEEALMFDVHNDQKYVNSVTKFRMRVIGEEDPVAADINTALVKHGWTVQTGQVDGYFMAVGAIEKAYKAAKGDHDEKIALIERTIQVITDAWDHNFAGMKAPLVQGVAAFLDRYGDDIDTARLVQKLADYRGGPRNLAADAKQYADLRSGYVWEAVAEIIVNTLNKGLGVNSKIKLPKWHTT